jgi:hypothetical protein
VPCVWYIGRAVVVLLFLLWLLLLPEELLSCCVVVLLLLGFEPFSVGDGPTRPDARFVRCREIVEFRVWLEVGGW